ncbi:ABC transporter ATP-binding protein [Anaerocolumna cellulosilytica]|uniref:ABC transporter ATP-binding protein n=1 Tax=Anaerocolumna cellulosilytica TaxID=433286 RepID=A0A6S6R527_9FIRM|nr:ABC transporter ATP-binding protein [Anaerocolumna cellulosilytica]MBB5197785.1 peptide/nickel transport system ATP-binding protein [Anaerocolumna cellulosilytica]BCJ96449.1 ABC transporter ATP-binding protein [Anaerocolumna cellulosilytica]
MQEKEDILVKVEGLTLGFPVRREKNTVIDGITFSLKHGEILGLVGESGSGKTMTALAIAGLLPESAKVFGGKLMFLGKNLLSLKKQELRQLKGKEMSMIFQEPMTSLNPVMTIGFQIEEMLLLHEKSLSGEQRKTKIYAAFEEAGLKGAKELYYMYPHQLSGGMRQRVMIAMAMICKPRLLIADEPTTALDVTLQAQILKLLQKLQKDYNTAILLISHDLGVIRQICSRALVMKNGKIEEQGLVEEIFSSPKTSYTKELIEAVPVIDNMRQGAKASSVSIINSPSEEVILSVRDLEVKYEEKAKGFLKEKSYKQVVNRVSLHLLEGESLGIVGESGSGKTTLAKAVLGLVDNWKGNIKLAEKAPRMVFQDPYQSLNPSKKVGWILEEPLKLSGSGYGKEERQDKVDNILVRIGLNTSYKDRYLSQLSGGQRQRIAIGAALIQNSKFIVLDEPVSALDVTVQAQILDLLKELREEYKLSYLFISHDLKVIHKMCDRVCVMYQGEIVEEAPVSVLFTEPSHGYSKKLLEAVL